MPNGGPVGAVELEGEQGAKLRRRRSCRGKGGGAGQAFLEEVSDGLGPDGGVVAPETAGIQESAFVRAQAPGGNRLASV